MPLFSIVILLALLAVAGFAGYSLGARSADVPAPGRDIEAEEFIEHLREMTWQHRDVAPELATILLDEIAQRHRGQLG